MHINAESMSYTVHKTLAVSCINRHLTSSTINRCAGNARFNNMYRGFVGGKYGIIDGAKFRRDVSEGKVRVMSDAYPPAYTPYQT